MADGRQRPSRCWSRGAGPSRWTHTHTHWSRRKSRPLDLGAISRPRRVASNVRVHARVASDSELCTPKPRGSRVRANRPPKPRTVCRPEGPCVRGAREFARRATERFTGAAAENPVGRRARLRLFMDHCVCDDYNHKRVPTVRHIAISGSRTSVSLISARRIRAGRSCIRRACRRFDRLAAGALQTCATGVTDV